MAAPDRIAALLARDLAAITQQLIDGGSVAQWERAMLEAITRGHAAAGIAGASERILREQGRRALERWTRDRELSETARRTVREAVKGQAPYLRGFAAELGTLSDAQIAARAALYAGATRATYSRGRWEGRHLPAHPTEGSECITQCGCSWVERDGAMYWERGKNDSCPTCVSREARWRPWRE